MILVRIRMTYCAKFVCRLFHSKHRKSRGDAGGTQDR